MVATIELLGEAQLPALLAHFRRHAAESGRDGDLVFRPRSATEEFEELEVAERQRVAWTRSLVEPLWLRTWALVEGDALIGHLDLDGGRLPAELHRATLGMGVERHARNRGHGRALLETAIAWARRHGLAWLDLGVFAHNAPARALYRKHGFVEIGTSRDRFRVDGVSIDDVSMVLAL